MNIFPKIVPFMR